jgi:rhamnose transport system permease protein
MLGVILSILLVLNLRNGLALANVTGNTQTGVIGALLILSVLIPNLAARARSRLARRSLERRAGGGPGAGDQAERREVESIAETISG